MRAFQISALVETAVRDERERGIIRSKALEDAARQALEVLERAGEELRWQAIGQVQRDLRAALAEPIGTSDYPNSHQRKPLTDEKLDRLWREMMSADWEHREFARAIEAAHGIGGQDEST